MIVETQKKSKKNGTLKKLWIWFSQAAGIMSLINLFDDIAKWKGAILSIVSNYQTVIDSLVDFVSLIVQIDVPNWFANYSIFGIVVCRNFWTAFFTEKQVEKSSTQFRNKWLTKLYHIIGYTFVSMLFWPIIVFTDIIAVLAIDSEPQEMEKASLKSLRYTGLSVGILIVLALINHWFL